MVRRIIAASFGLMVALCLGLLPGGPAFAADPAGEWHGALAPTPMVKLRLVLEVKRTADGAYAGAMTSVDQGGPPIPLSAVASSGDELSFTIAAINGGFKGAWDAGRKAWVGTWTQSGQSFPLTFESGPLPPTPVVQGLDGAWTGVLTTQRGQVHLVLRVRTDALGASAALDSPDQAAFGITVDGLGRQGRNVVFALTALGASYAGALSDDGAELSGAWTQAGQSNPLDFKRTSASAAPAAFVRPQTPKKPYPYREEAATFDDAAAHVKLAGTLTLPPGPGPFPAVVLVAGSGPNTRNEPIAGHQPFLVLADYFTRQGIAVLRYDKRGTGASGGDYASATTSDFADDAEAAETWLRGRPEIDAAHVGLVGQSEGGLIVPIVAVRDPTVSFIVMMAGPGVDGLDLWLEQGRLLLKAGGASDAWVSANSGLRRTLIDIVQSEKDPGVIAAKMKVAMAAFAKANDLPPQSLAGLDVLAQNAGWWRFFLRYDPADTLRRVRCPVLALIGSKDLQVPADQNLPAIRAALAGNPNAEVLELPNLNHLFQTARTGGIGEYFQNTETIAPLALGTISEWIRKQAARGPHHAAA